MDDAGSGLQMEGSRSKRTRRQGQRNGPSGQKTPTASFRAVEVHDARLHEQYYNRSVISSNNFDFKKRSNEFKVMAAIHFTSTVIDSIRLCVTSDIYCRYWFDSPLISDAIKRNDRLCCAAQRDFCLSFHRNPRELDLHLRKTVIFRSQITKIIIFKYLI